MVGGLLPKALKKEKGARFRLPSLLIVLTKAIGLGVIPPQSHALVSMGLRLFASMVFIRDSPNFQIRQWGFDQKDYPGSRPEAWELPLEAALLGVQSYSIKIPSP